MNPKKRVTLICAHCKNPFERCKAEAARRGPLQWCSWKCWRGYHDEHRTSYPKIGNRHAHRIIAEKKLGRKLTSADIIHHKDENRQNFSAGNLQLSTRVRHGRLHGRKFSKLRTRDTNGKFIKS